MTLVDVGVRLVMDQFNTFQKNGESVNRTVATMTQKMQGLADSMNNKLSPANLMLGNALGQYLVRGIDSVINKIQALTVGSLDVAGRFQQLTQIAYLLAQQQGMTAAEVDKTIASIRKQGIEASIAADMVSQFARYELDLKKATDLAKVAQDAAQMTGHNSSETLQSLLWGIQTYNTEIFRTAGIQVNVSNAFDTYAKTLNKSAQSMTSAEKSQAVLNAVLEEGKKIAGAYDVSLGTAAKVWSSYPRIVNDLQVALGTPFLEASRQAGLALTALTKGFAEAFDTGGKLNPMLNDVGAGFAAFFSLLHDGAKGAVDAVVNFFSSDLFRSLSDTLGRAAEWGFNLIASFAIGIASGVSTVLVAVMQLVADTLSFFLESHSPPKVAPDIDKWGAAAMTSYLEGFKEADFSALNGLQNIIRSALSGLGQTGNTLESNWRNLSGGLIQALGIGNADVIVGQIRGTLGMYGTEVAELVQKQFALAKATKEVESAEKALNDSRKAVTDSQQKLTTVIDEYNQMTKTETDPAKLEAKRKEFELSRTAYTAAVQKQKADEAAYTKAKEAIDPLQKAVSLQQSLVETLIEMTKVQQEQKTGGGGALGATVKSIDDLKKSVGGLSTDMQSKIDGFKNKLSEIFAPLVKAYDEQVKPKLEEMGVQLARISKTLQDAGIFDTKGQANGVAIEIGKWVGGLWLVSVIGGKVVGLFSGLAKIVSTIGGLFGVGGGGVHVGSWTVSLSGLIPYLAPIAIILAGISAIVLAIATNWQGVNDTASKLFELLKIGFKNPSAIFGTFFDEVKGNFEEFANQISKLPNAVGKGDWDAAWKTIKESFGGLGSGMEKTWNDKVKPTLDTLWESASTRFKEIFLDKLTDQLEKWGITKTIEGVWEKVKTKTEEIWNDIRTKTIGPVLDGIIKDFEDKFAGPGKTVWGLVEDAWNKITGKTSTATSDMYKVSGENMDLIHKQFGTVFSNTEDTTGIYGVFRRFISVMTGANIGLWTVMKKDTSLIEGMADPVKRELMVIIEWLNTGIARVNSLIEGFGKLAGLSLPTIPSIPIPGGGGGGGGSGESGGGSNSEEGGSSNKKGYIPAMAGGGLMNRYRPYLVGENGPEIITPNVTGYVTPYSALQNVIRNLAVNPMASRISPVDTRQVSYNSNVRSETQRIYNLTLQTTQSANSVQQGFQVMQIMGA